MNLQAAPTSPARGLCVQELSNPIWAHAASLESGAEGECLSETHCERTNLPRGPSTAVSLDQHPHHPVTQLRAWSTQEATALQLLMGSELPRHQETLHTHPYHQERRTRNPTDTTQSFLAYPLARVRGLRGGGRRLPQARAQGQLCPPAPRVSRGLPAGPQHRSTRAHSHRVTTTRSVVSAEGSSGPPGKRSRDLGAGGRRGLGRALGPRLRASADKLRSLRIRAREVHPWGRQEIPAT